LIILAPAKLNRFLAVLGRRADGYHEPEPVTTVLDGVSAPPDRLEGHRHHRGGHNGEPQVRLIAPSERGSDHHHDPRRDTRSPCAPPA